MVVAHFLWLGSVCPGNPSLQSSSLRVSSAGWLPLLECSASRGLVGLAGLLQGKRALPEGSGDLQVSTTMEAAFLWLGRVCLGASGPWSSSRRQVVLGGCSMGLQHLSKLAVATWSLQGKGALSQGMKDWQVHTVMEADFPWLSRACPSASGPQSSYRGRQFWVAAS